MATLVGGSNAKKISIDLERAVAACLHCVCCVQSDVSLVSVVCYLLYVHVCVGEGRAGQEKRGEEKVDTIQKNTRTRNNKGAQKRWKHDDNSVGNYKKQETLGTLSKHGLRFWRDMVIHGPPKKSENGHFLRRIVFTFCQRFPT